ncbi:LAME_0H20186g1_1 [Lachancea meyersii CBS 8951]|uniref:Dolichyl-diphosphooligosaccharide-protein glycosyltransferase subunit OST5 n=1 Tax=Lachancea meyersii CBS 8951 TaxID=1266667 RepID=A0A1G4KJI4_9SACH|nr:LAME_0H20186g1_1 [Lachancea meyersii CBS 8951]
MLPYEEIHKLYRKSPKFDEFIPLESQPIYATVALLAALAFIGLAMTLPAKASGASFALQSVKYTALSLIGSLFMGIAIVFLTNSFGVYA